MRSAPRRWLISAVLLLVACEDRARIQAPLTLADGTVIPLATLARGEVVYAQNCVVCHGAEGDGAGSSAAYMRPSPRAFRQALFKFGGVAAGELPTDEALERVIRRGLHGTPMLGWELTPKDRRAVAQYLKTFSSRWREEPPGEPIQVEPDPWGTRADEAIARGRALFHVSGAGHAGCIGCHPAYVAREELRGLIQRATGRLQQTFPADLHGGRARDSDHALALDEQGEPTRTARLYATDFLTQPLRTVWPLGARVDGAVYTAERQREDLYRVIAAGVGGTAMPTWKGALSEESLWALAYYAQSLMVLKDTDSGFQLSRALAADVSPTSDAGPAP